MSSKQGEIPSIDSLDLSGDSEVQTGPGTDPFQHGSPRFFLGNFDFEHRLAEPTRETPEKLQRVNASLATAWLSIANDGDWIWTPTPLDTKFFQEAVDQGLPNVVPVTSFSDVPKGTECVPWGWSADVRSLMQQFEWTAAIPSDQAVRKANSRATSEELERLWDVGLDNARRIESLEDAFSSLQKLGDSETAWVIKAEFGMSARERILGRGPLKPADENWIRRRLALNGVVFFEPWVKRIGEVGIQVDVPEHGDPQFVGLTPMLVDRRGQYAGSWFAFQESRFSVEGRLWPEAITTAIRAAKHLQSFGYFGPLGIDAMVYHGRDGLPKIRPLQDINARWTMGRLSLGWRRLLRAGEEGCWQHSSQIDDSILPSDDGVRIIATSPGRIENHPCDHVSRILIHSVVDFS